MQSNIPCCVTKFVLQAESMWNLWDTTACGLLGTASVHFLITYSNWILQHTTALIYMYRKNLSRPNPPGTEEFDQFRHVFGLHKFKL